MEIISDFNNVTNICPECGGQIIYVQAKGEDVCGHCGLIISERMLDIAHGSKRAYNHQEKSAREQHGSPISILLPDMGLSTVIDRKNITNPDLKRAAKWNSRVTWEKRNLLIATTELKRISSNLNLPDHAKREAMRLYKQAFAKKLLRGRSINGMVAASIYFACKKKKIPRTLQEILDQTSESAKNVRRCYITLVKELKLKVPSINPISLISRFIVELGLNAEIENTTNKIISKYVKNIPISGKDPKGICAGSLYLACKIHNKNVTQKNVAEVVGVTEVTLRSRYKELIKKLKIEV